ncbi:MAG: VanZ family protein [Opitutaceae bacterium]
MAARLTWIRTHYRWCYPLAIAAAVVFGSSRSEIAGPAVVGFDKVAHFGAFGLLATAAYRLVPRRAGVWVVLAVSLFGASDEWHQSFTAGRSVELADWIADTSGAAVAVLAYGLWQWYRNLLEYKVLPVKRARRVEKMPLAESTGGL